MTNKNKHETTRVSRAQEPEQGAGSRPLTRIGPTFWIRIYMSGPIEVAKQALRQECLRAGLCITIEPTLFIYTGGEEHGFVVGLLNYPRFPSEPSALDARASVLVEKLLDATCQHSALIVERDDTRWITRRERA